MRILKSVDLVLRGIWSLRFPRTRQFNTRTCKFRHRTTWEWTETWLTFNSSNSNSSRCSCNRCSSSSFNSRINKSMRMMSSKRRSWETTWTMDSKTPWTKRNTTTIKSSTLMTMEGLPEVLTPSWIRVQASTWRVKRPITEASMSLSSRQLLIPDLRQAARAQGDE